MRIGTPEHRAADQPATLDASPLGACMRNVLLATQFPAGEQTFIWTPVLH
jgi:hypothetical protein